MKPVSSWLPPASDTSGTDQRTGLESLTQKKIKKYTIIEAVCHELVPGGFGLSYLPDDTYPDDYMRQTGFVIGVLPGERFLAEVRQSKKDHFHAVLLPKEKIPEDYNWLASSQQMPDADSEWALFNRSEQRVDSPCDRFIHCGGCRHLNLSYEDTLDQKLKWLRARLDHHRVEYPDIEVVASPEKYHYRNNVQVHINKYAERGFYSPFTYRTVAFPEHGCLIFNQRLFDENFPEEHRLVRCVRGRIDNETQTAGIWPLYSPEDKKARFTYTVNWPAGARTEVTIPNTAFFQVNSSILPVWLGHIDAAIRDINKDDNELQVLELFSGFGFITRMMNLKHNLKVTGIDILKPVEASAVRITCNDKEVTEPCFEENYQKADLTTLDEAPEAVKARIRNMQPDLLMMNPPRSGFKPAQMRFLFDSLLKEPPPAVIYSSCNAATLARDLEAAADYGYRIESITMLDFFPWTSHSETLAVLKR